MQQKNLLIGAAWMLAASFSFSIMGAVIRTLSLTFNNESIVFFRSLFGLLLLLPWRLGQSPSLGTDQLSGHLARAFFGLSAMYCFFYAISKLNLATAVLLNFSAPMFIPIFAWILLKEPSSRRIWIAIGVGFLGILFILKPSQGLWNSAALIGTCSGILAAMAMIFVRKLGRTEPASRTLFYFTMLSTLGSAIPMLLFGKMPQLQHLPLLLLLGISANAGQYMLIRAYQMAPAPQIGPFSYSAVLFAAILGWWMWAEVPDQYSLIGTVLVIAAGILTLRAGMRKG